MTPEITFDDFRDEWLADVRAGSPSTVELGRRFAFKPITQWLDLNEPSDDLVYCDGAGDGGIDATSALRYWRVSKTAHVARGYTTRPYRRPPSSSQGRLAHQRLSAGPSSSSSWRCKWLPSTMPLT